MPENRSFDDLPHPSEVQRAGGMVLSQSQNDMLGNISAKKDLDRMVALRVAEQQKRQAMSDKTRARYDDYMSKKTQEETDATSDAMGDGIKTLITLAILGGTIYVAWLLMSGM